jgi:hypothetical protein
VNVESDILREQFLNSQRYEDWNHYFKFVCSQQPADLEVGDKIKVNIKGSVLGVSIMVSTCVAKILNFCISLSLGLTHTF